MAQLDQLIGALVQHKAESLVLAQGQKPALVMDGTPRPIVKVPLDGEQVLRLVAEIAPEDRRSTVAAGAQTSFAYAGGGTAVQVEVLAGPEVRIRQALATAAPTAVENPAPPAPAAPGAAPQATTAEAPAATAAAPAGEMTMDALLRKLVALDGSDLHLSSTCRPMIRVHGEMRELDGYPTLDADAAGPLLLAIVPERNKQQFEETGDTDFAYEIEGLCRFRCNLFRDRKGPGGVFRAIPSKLLTAEELGLSIAVQNLCQLIKGLVLVTGPTGSGKSTTLATMVDLANRTRSDHIITIEDPIEFVHENQKCLVNQREVHRHTAGFKRALRAALREDPDVVLVGELRDLETMAIAIETAETGHLVFGTLHTSSAVSTVDRIIDQFPADQQEQIRVMLSESLRAVISQVLCKKIGGGRVAALEVLMVNAAVSNLIREGKTFQIPSIMQTGKNLGNVLLNAALLELVEKKLVEPQEAYLKATDKHNLLSAFKAKSIPTDFVREEKKREAPA